jgi:hypothetical protein
VNHRTDQRASSESWWAFVSVLQNTVLLLQGKSGINKACFGRLSYGLIRATIVGRAETDKEANLHPEQPRTYSIRESARCQVCLVVSLPPALSARLPMEFIIPARDKKGIDGKLHLYVKPNRRVPTHHSSVMPGTNATSTNHATMSILVRYFNMNC